MKKTITLFLAILMIVAVFAACKNTETTSSSKPDGSQTDLSSTTEESKTEESKTEEGTDLSAKTLNEIIDMIYETKKPEFMIGSMDVDLTNAESAKSYTGLSDFSKIKEAVASEALVGSQAYSLVLVRVKDAADAKAVATEMLGGIDQRKWICVEADDLQVVTSGDLVMLIMMQSDFENIKTQDIVDSFKTVAGGTLDNELKK